MDETLSETLEYLNVEQVTVTYSRPNNLKDLPTKAKLHQAPDREASKYYYGEVTRKQAAPYF